MSPAKKERPVSDAPGANETPTMPAPFSSGPAPMRTSSVPVQTISHIHSLGAPKLSTPNSDIYSGILAAFGENDGPVMEILPAVLYAYLECLEVKEVPIKGSVDDVRKCVRCDDATSVIVTFENRPFIIIFHDEESKEKFESSNRHLLDYILFAASTFKKQEQQKADIRKSLEMITHLVRGKLAACTTNAGMVASEIASTKVLSTLISEDSHRALNTINQAAHAAVKKLDQYRLAIKYQSSIRLNLSPINVQDKLTEVVNSAKQSLGITIRLASTLDQEIAMLDPGIIEDVLQELFENAKKYCRCDMKTKDIDVIVYAHRNGRSLVINVIDNGPGFKEDEVEDLFDMYKRASSTSASCKGTGIGLAYCKAMCDKHEGSIRATNREGHSGANFTITLPLDLA